MEGDLTWGCEHTVEYMNDVLQNFTPETHIILLTVSPQEHSMKKRKGKSFSNDFKDSSYASA